MRFVKMHGLGNDYVYVNCFEQRLSDPAQMAVRVSDRHFGIGADGLILVCPSEAADVRMRMFNADGSESEMCGNGVRCVAKFAYDRGLAGHQEAFEVPGQASMPLSMRIETGRGVLRLGLSVGTDGKVERVCVNMGEPILAAAEIPVAVGGGDRVVDETIEVLGRQLRMTCVSMGNPHAVFFVPDVVAVDLERLGPAVEHHTYFPKRVNAHFVQMNGPGAITVRTWERGSGITLACGTGACACCVAGVLTGRSGRVVRAHLPGGDLDLNWCEQDGCVYMTGPAVEVFEGVWPD
ncbi:MAG TPA: diaminopimelate epimerase [Phycisphaerales bacterium]|nr:diaminopimelate epimerase [Phycisphaerales bacterium]